MEQCSESRNLVRSAYSALAAGDDAGFMARLAPDAVWVVPGPDDHPATGTHSGKDALAKMFARFGTVAELLGIEIEHVVGDGSPAVVLGRERWRVRESGREFETIWANAVTVTNSLISRVVVYADTHNEMDAYNGK